MMKIYIFFKKLYNKFVVLNKAYYFEKALCKKNIDISNYNIILFFTHFIIFLQVFDIHVD